MSSRHSALRREARGFEPHPEADLAIWPLNVYWDPGQGYYFDCSRYENSVNYWHWCSPAAMQLVKATDDLTLSCSR